MSAPDQAPEPLPGDPGNGDPGNNDRSMLPDDPGDTDRAITIRLTRDSLILLAAVAFLAVAILLAAVFGSPATNVSPEATSIARMTRDARPAATQPARATEGGRATAQAPTLAVSSAVAIEPSMPPAQAPTSAAPLPSPAVPVPTSAQPGAYPGPDTPPSPTVAGQAPTASPPVFAPTVLVPTPQLPTPRQAPTQAPAQPTPVQVTQAPPTQAPPTPASPNTVQPTIGQAQPPAPTRIPQPQPTAAPTAPPVTMLRGTNYWKASQSPIIVARDLALAPGAALIIEPGVEVRIAPGISISSQGKLYAVGKPGQPVRFVGTAPQRWEGIFGRAGSELVFEQVEIRGGGAGGTVIDSEGGSLVLRGVRINDNGGHVHSAGSRLEVRDSEISGNDMPYGAALDASFSGGTTTVLNNRIGGNRMAAGAPQVLLHNASGFDGLTVDVQGNLLIGQDGPNLTLSTGSTPLYGNVVCNAFLNGANGLSIRSETLQTPGFSLTIRNNAIDDHIPPIVPEYLKYGIGRGATSEVQIDMRENWWGSPLGPYEPDRHADGRGDSVGENIAFEGWLGDWPGCAPRP